MVMIPLLIMIPGLGRTGFGRDEIYPETYPDRVLQGFPVTNTLISHPTITPSRLISCENVALCHTSPKSM